MPDPRTEQLAPASVDRLRALLSRSATQLHDDERAELEVLARALPAWAGPFAPVGVIATCPQIQGIDAPTILLSRAVWVDGGLYLRLEPEVEAYDRWIGFQVVGAEPRQWDVIAPDGTTVELTMAGLNIRTRRVSAVVELTPGSY